MQNEDQITVILVANEADQLQDFRFRQGNNEIHSQKYINKGSCRAVPGSCLSMSLP